MKKWLGWMVLLGAMLAVAPAARAQVIVIANNSVKSTEVTKVDLRDVFSGNATSFKDGSHVVPVLLKGGAVHDEFLSSFVGKPDSAFKASWRSLVFSGQANMPKAMDTDAAVVEFVAHTAGAVGYISKLSPHDGVKTLSVR